MSVSIEEAKQYIDKIDFRPMLDKLVNYCGWLRVDAEQTCQQYRNFLYLNKKYRDIAGVLPPSEDIDEIWHNHILDTEKYILDCQAIFGKYMHHYPYLGIDGNEDINVSEAFDNLKQLYLQEFNQELEATRSKYPKFIYALLLKYEKLREKWSTKNPDIALDEA